MQKVWALLLTVSILGLSLGGPARWGWAAEYPERPVELINGFAAGGIIDILARALSPTMGKHLGQPIVPTIKAGAGGEIGATAVYKARPDGYTIGIVVSPNIFVQPLQRSVGFNPEKFSIIGIISFDENVLAVGMDTPFDSLEKFLDAARKNPAKIRVGHSGLYGDDHVALLLLHQAAGIKTTQVPFGGSALAMTTALGGHIEAIVDNAGNLANRRDQFRVLATFGDLRSELMPDVPTLKERGINLRAGSGRILVGPPALPRDVLLKLGGALKLTVQDPAYVEAMKKANFPAMWMEPKELGRFMEQERARAQGIAEDLAEKK